MGNGLIISYITGILDVKELTLRLVNRVWSELRTQHTSIEELASLKKTIGAKKPLDRKEPISAKKPTDTKKPIGTERHIIINYKHSY